MMAKAPNPSLEIVTLPPPPHGIWLGGWGADRKVPPGKKNFCIAMAWLYVFLMLLCAGVVCGVVSFPCTSIFYFMIQI